MAEYEWIRYGRILVAFTRDLDGGGTSFGQTFIPFVEKNLGKVDRVFEWCAGPGFIGFSLLAHGLCNSLSLADKKQTAVDAAMTSVRVNGLARSVSVYRSDCLDDIPAHESWNLAVANPPHSRVDKAVPEIAWPQIIYADVDWSAHRRFYSQVSSFLRPGASVLVIENSLYSGPADFKPMIEKAGLQWVGSYDATESYYFVWSKVAG